MKGGAKHFSKHAHVYLELPELLLKVTHCTAEPTSVILTMCNECQIILDRADCRRLIAALQSHLAEVSWKRFPTDPNE